MKAKLGLQTLLMSVLLLPAAAYAASSDWAEERGARIRLVVAEPAPDAKEIRAVLQIELEPGWKTYWRDPGAAGVPPKISFEGSTNIAGFTLYFPVPERFVEGDSVSTGYKGPLAFPVTLQLNAPEAASLIKASAFLGVCDEICVPVQVNFSVDVPVANASTPDQALVDGFFAALPKPAAPGFTIVSLDRAEKSLSVKLEAPASGGEPQLFLAADGSLLGVPKLTASSGTIFEFNVPIAFEPKSAPLDGVDLHFTAVAGDNAVSGTTRVAAK